MPIHETQLRQLEIIENATENKYRDVGYDLTVGDIYIPRDEDNKQAPHYVDEESFEIPPQGIVLLFSAETVTMPQGICGYAMPKTGLCEEGLLVLNTGILDPNYSGRISGTTINFRKSPIKISKGDAFLRLTFHKIEPSPPQGEDTADLPQVSDEVYKLQRTMTAHEYPATFLNVPATVRDISNSVHKDLLGKLRNELWIVLAMVGLTITVSLAIVRWGFPVVDNWAHGNQRIEKLEQETSDLKQQITTLQQQRTQSTPAQNPATP